MSSSRAQQDAARLGTKVHRRSSTTGSSSSPPAGLERSGSQQQQQQQRKNRLELSGSQQQQQQQQRGDGLEHSSSQQQQCKEGLEGSGSQQQQRRGGLEHSSSQQQQQRREGLERSSSQQLRRKRLQLAGAQSPVVLWRSSSSNSGTMGEGGGTDAADAGAVAAQGTHLEAAAAAALAAVQEAEYASWRCRSFSSRGSASARSSRGSPGAAFPLHLLSEAGGDNAEAEKALGQGGEGSLGEAGPLSVLPEGMGEGCAGGQQQGHHQPQPHPHYHHSMGEGLRAPGNCAGADDGWSEHRGRQQGLRRTVSAAVGRGGGGGGGGGSGRKEGGGGPGLLAIQHSNRGAGGSRSEEGSAGSAAAGAQVVPVQEGEGSGDAQQSLGPRPVHSPRRPPAAEPPRPSRLQVNSTSVAMAAHLGPSDPPAAASLQPGKRARPPLYASLAIDTDSPPRSSSAGNKDPVEGSDSSSGGSRDSDGTTPTSVSPLDASPMEALEARLMQGGNLRASDAGTEFSSVLRPRYAPTLSRSSSMQERQDITKNSKEAIAAALRARHARRRMAKGNAKGVQVITGKHVTDASKFAHMMGGQADSALVGLVTPRDRRLKNIEKLAASLEELFGPIQQTLSGGATCGEVELLGSSHNETPEGEQGPSSVSRTPRPGIASPRRGSRRGASSSGSPRRRDGVGGGARLRSPSSIRTRASPDLPPEVRKRIASVLALSPCCMLRIDVVAYQDTLMDWRRQELAKRLEFYNTIAPLKGLRQQTLIVIDSAIHWLSVKRGALLQQIGEPLRGVCLIKSGQVGLYMAPACMCLPHDLLACEHAREQYDKEVLDSGGIEPPPPANLSDAPQGRPASAGPRYSSRAALRPVTILGPGDFFGEDALVTGMHTVAVLAETPCELGWVAPADMPVMDRLGILQLLRCGAMRNTWRLKRRNKGPELYHHAALRQTSRETGDPQAAGSQSAQRLEAELLQHAVALGRLQSDGTLWVASAIRMLKAAARDRARSRLAELGEEQPPKMHKPGRDAALAVLQGDFDLEVYARWLIAEDNFRWRAASKQARREVAQLQGRAPPLHEGLLDSSDEDAAWVAAKDGGQSGSGAGAGGLKAAGPVVPNGDASTEQGSAAAAAAAVAAASPAAPAVASPAGGCSPPASPGSACPALQAEQQQQQQQQRSAPPRLVMGVKRAPHLPPNTVAHLPQLPTPACALALATLAGGQAGGATQSAISAGPGGECALLVPASVLAADRRGGCTAGLLVDGVDVAAGWRAERDVAAGDAQQQQQHQQQQQQQGAQWAAVDAREQLQLLQLARACGGARAGGASLGIGSRAGGPVMKPSGGGSSRGKSSCGGSGSSGSEGEGEGSGGGSGSDSGAKGAGGAHRQRGGRHSRKASVSTPLPTVVEASYATNPPDEPPSREGSHAAAPHPQRHQPEAEHHAGAGSEGTGSSGASSPGALEPAVPAADAPPTTHEPLVEGASPESHASDAASAAPLPDPPAAPLAGVADRVEGGAAHADAEAAAAAALQDSVLQQQQDAEGAESAGQAALAAGTDGSGCGAGAAPGARHLASSPPEAPLPAAATAAAGAAKPPGQGGPPAQLPTGVPRVGGPAHARVVPSCPASSPGLLSSRLLVQPPHLPTAAATALDFVAPNIATETISSHAPKHQQQQQEQQGNYDDSAEWAVYHPRLPFRGFVKGGGSWGASRQQQQRQRQQQQGKGAALLVDGPAYNAHTFLRPKPSPRALQRVAQGAAAKLQLEQEQALLAPHMLSPLTLKPRPLQ